NTVVRTGVGAYTAMLPNLGTATGKDTVHVTAHGLGTETCKVASWGPSVVTLLTGVTGTQNVNVRCFTSSGAPVDTFFTLTCAHPSSLAGAMAFLWADKPTPAGSTPIPSYPPNSPGATNTVVRTGVGPYTANLPNLGGPKGGGHVQVTAYGT